MWGITPKKCVVLFLSFKIQKVVSPDFSELVAEQKHQLILFRGYWRISLVLLPVTFFQFEQQLIISSQMEADLSDKKVIKAGNGLHSLSRGKFLKPETFLYWRVKGH